MWKLFIFTFLCLFLRTSCDDTSAVAAAAAAVKIGSSNGYSDSTSSAAAVAQYTSSSGSGSSPNSNDDSYDDGESSEEDDDEYDCNLEERDDDYDCTSALPRVERAIIKISFIRKNIFLKNNLVNNNYCCNINQTQGKEGHVGSPLATWYVVAMVTLNTEDETLDELLDFLGLQNKDECRCIMKKIRRLIKPFLKDFVAYSAAIMADKKKYSFTDIFIMDVIKYLDGKLLTCNFNKPLTCARKVNKYTAGKTGNLVLDVVSKQKASTVFNKNQIIDSVIGSYIKPTFKMSLNTKNITTGIYYGLNGPTLTNYLNQKVIHNSMESRKLNARLISLELKQNNTQCLIIVPNIICDLQFIVTKLAAEPQILQDEMKCLKRTLMYLTTPAYESFTTVENVVPALQSTCKINRVFDITKSQFIDSCGRSLNRSITYIHEKSIAIFSPVGVEPYKPASAKDCSGCGEPVTVRINAPAIFIYFIYNIPVAGLMCEVMKMDSCTN